MHYTVYQTTNLVNGKIYIGAHKTADLKDIYMGSGKILLHAIAKHGIDNFKKEILFEFDNPADMYSKEKELVNRDFIKSNSNYNINVGGNGGFDYINATKSTAARSAHGKLGYIANKEKMVKNTIAHQTRAGHRSYELLAGIHGADMTRRQEWCSVGTAAALLPESRAKRIKTLEKIKHQQGSTNSQFGTMWITNGASNKKVPKDQLLTEGWYKGRKIKI